MKKQVAVIGLGRFGSSLAKTLHEAGHEVLAIDKDETRVQEIADKVTHAVQADATNESVLTELGLKDFDVAMVAMGSAIESSVLCTILLRNLGVKYVVARADHDLHGSILRKIGANWVVLPEREKGVDVAHVIALREVRDYMWLNEGNGISRLMSPKYLVGRTLGELGFGPSGESKIAVLVMERGDNLTISPSLDETLQVGDRLILCGSDDELERLLEKARSDYPDDNGEQSQ
jgi:trk system potassium uptake protein TrkA